MKPLNIITGIFLFGIGIWFVSAMATCNGQTIENQVATDAVKQYKIAKRQGDKMQTYVQAGLVCAAYLQAKDEPNYIIWKNREDSLARKLHLHVSN